MRSTVTALALLLAACSGGETEPMTPEPAPAPAPEEPPPPPAAEQADANLVPSPTEIQRALEAAGIQSDLPSYITHPNPDFSRTDEDHAAVRTGVILADMLLTVKTSDKEQLLAQIDGIYKGMEQLEGGEDILATLTDIRDRVESDAVTRDELLEELEMLSAAVIPELEFNGRARVVPLIQAGSWLEASNLLAKAVRAAEKPSAADGLLKQPEVVAYFKKYVSDHGSDAPPAMTTTLMSSLETLDAVAGKADSLTTDDIDRVITSTNTVLELL